MPRRSRGIALPTTSQWVVLSLVSVGCWLGWGEFAAFQERQGLWNPAATATERIRAADAWSEQGEAAVPDLIRALNDPHAQTRRYAAVALAQLETRGRGAVTQLREHLKDPHPVVRGQVVATLAVVDPDSAESIEAVAALLADPDREVRQEAAASLRTWGPLAEPTIVSQLSHPLPMVREIAIGLIPRTSAARRAVLPVVRELTADPSSSVKSAAVTAIIESGTATLPELIEWLALDNEKVSTASASALRQFGPEAAVAVPELIRCLERSHTRNQLQVIETLRGIGPAAEKAVPALLACIDRASERTALVPLQAIEAIGAKPEVLIEPLDRLAGHHSSAVAGTALRMLHGYAPDRARARIDQLISRLGGSDQFQIQVACSTIPHLGVLAEGAVPNLQVQLDTGDRQLRHFALHALRSLGPAAAPVVPSIVSLLNNSADDPASFDALVETIIAIGADARAASNAILAHLHYSLQSGNEFQQIRRRARLIVAAARIGAITPEFRETLHDFLESGQSIIQVAALEALEVMGKSDGPERAMIVDALDAHDPATRMAAIHAIPSALGGEQTAADALANCLTDPEVRVRVAAAQALARLGHSARTALPALRTAISDSVNSGPALSIVPMNYGLPHPRFQPRLEDHLPPSATVSDVMEQAIRDIESTTTTTFSQ